MAIFYLALIVIAALIVAWFIKPKHVRVEFPGPPGFARVNTPKPEWPESRRTVILPNGDEYTIPAGKRGHFVVPYDWPVECEIEDKTETFAVPRGTATDFASIPRFLHSLISPLNNTIYSAVLHDYLYRDPTDFRASSVSRASADRAFCWGMSATGVWRPTAGLMYAGVRIGGFWSYERSNRAVTQHSTG